MKAAILVVSFGTTHEETEIKNIRTIENQIKEQFSDYAVYSAYTSSIVRKILKKNGRVVDDVESALKRISADGLKHVLIQPTHLLYGFEYEKIETAVAKTKSDFDQIQVGKPLLSETRSMMSVIKSLDEELSPTADRAVVLMGHGSEHFANAAYPAMNFMAREMGCLHLYIGTVEGYPELDSIIKLLKAENYKEILLAPMMLVAGDHAVNDMASDEEDSWKTLLEGEGFSVICLVKGLGEYKGIRSLYIEHLREIIEK